MVTYSSGFIGNFKLGDNIARNCEILHFLYKCQQSGNDYQADVLRKPIIVIIGSIAEAILYDLYVVKISTFKSEGVPNIPKDVLEEIRTKTIDEFAKYITHARSKALLGTSPDIYDSLDELRKLRNRVHIQNAKGHFEASEVFAFSDSRQAAAELTLEQLIDHMVKTYTRMPHRQHVKDFVLPWDSRLGGV